jgi:putative transposase
MEELQPTNMLKNHHLAKSIADASWGILRNTLEAKAVEWGREIVFVDPRNTSQECSGCGETVRKPLSQREHHCPNCGLRIHRDVNAAINILKRSGLGEAVRDSLALAG